MKRPPRIPHLDAVYDLLADANTEGARNADRMGRWDTAGSWTTPPATSGPVPPPSGRAVAIVADSLTWRCRQTLTIADNNCADRAVFWVYPESHPADGTAACMQHLGKAVRALLAVTAAAVSVNEISRMEKAA